MRELFWLSDKRLNDLHRALLASPATTEQLLRLVEREIKDRE